MKYFKKLLISLSIALLSILSFAQTPGTIKFLGVPVDGSKTEVIRQLRGKGFTYNASDGVLTGKFNGIVSNVLISENYGRVDRIFIADSETRTAAQIRIRFNNLIMQFRENEKYVELDENIEISDREDIDYEMTVHNKEYSASFYLNPVYGWTDKEKEELALDTAAELKARIDAGQFGNVSSDQIGTLLRDAITLKVLGMIQGQVWFKIAKAHGEYYLCIYYDNLKNRPNGEDL